MYLLWRLFLLLGLAHSRLTGLSLLLLIALREYLGQMLVPEHQDVLDGRQILLTQMLLNILLLQGVALDNLELLQIDRNRLGLRDNYL